MVVPEPVQREKIVPVQYYNYFIQFCWYYFNLGLEMMEAWIGSVDTSGRRKRGTNKVLSTSGTLLCREVQSRSVDH